MRQTTCNTFCTTSQSTKVYKAVGKIGYRVTTYGLISLNISLSKQYIIFCQILFRTSRPVGWPRLLSDCILMTGCPHVSPCSRRDTKYDIEYNLVWIWSMRRYRPVSSYLKSFLEILSIYIVKLVLHGHPVNHGQHPRNRRILGHLCHFALPNLPYAESRHCNLHAGYTKTYLGLTNRG